MRIQRIFGRALWAMTFVLLGAAVLADGTSSTLVARDPSHLQRRIACYTALELSVGVNEPSMLRPIEILVGLALVGYAPWAGRRRARHWLHRVGGGAGAVEQ